MVRGSKGVGVAVAVAVAVAMTAGGVRCLYDSDTGGFKSVNNWFTSFGSVVEALGLSC